MCTGGGKRADEEQVRLFTVYLYIVGLNILPTQKFNLKYFISVEKINVGMKIIWKYLFVFYLKAALLWNFFKLFQTGRTKEMY